MARKRRWKRTALVVGAGIVVAVAIIFLISRLVEQSAIGEEGLEPYDPLLASNTFTPSLWGVTPELSGLVVANEGDLWFRGSTAPSDPGCVVTSLSIICSAQSIKTIDLYNVRFKMEYSASLGWNSQSNSCGGTITFSTPEASYVVSKVGADKPSCQQGRQGTVELLWNDYEQGAYALLVDGVTVFEGFASGPVPLTITANGLSNSGNQATSTVLLKRPRSHALFGCDPRVNEVIASMTFTQGTTALLENLVGFQRFCVEHPAVHLEGGVSTGSVQVYYALANGERVRVGEDEAWRFFYVAKASLVAPGACTDAVDAVTGVCKDFTGLVDICPAGSLRNGICTVILANEVDALDFSELRGERNIRWAASDSRHSLKSGGSPLLTALVPVYSCQTSDGHSVGQRDLFRYPFPSADCYGVVIGNDEITGTPKMVDQFFAASLVLFDAQVAYDPLLELEGEFEAPGQWSATFDTTLVNDVLAVNPIEHDAEYTLGEDALYTVNVENKFSLPVLADIVAEYRPQAIGGARLVRRNVTLVPGANQVMFSADTGTIGQTNVRILPLLQTDAGSIQGGEVKTFQYQVSRGVASCPEGTVYNESAKWCQIIVEVITDCPDGYEYNMEVNACYRRIITECSQGEYDEETDSCVAEEGVFARFWAWIKGLFGG